MSYIPDYRQEVGKLNDVDRAYVQGYRNAIEDMKTIFCNLDMFEVTASEEAVLKQFEGCFEDYCEMQEIELVCSVFENADYLPEGIELKDANRPLYRKEK